MNDYEETKEEKTIGVREQLCKQSMGHALATLRAAKPDDRSEKSRQYAVTITELEKAIAYFEHWVCGQ